MARRHRPRISKAKRERIFERDGGICQICFNPVDPTLPMNHEERAALDHIERFRDHGDESDDNLRLTHQICNEIRERMAGF